MDLRPGYKQTEIGPIPEDWEVGELRRFILQDATYGVVKAGSFRKTGVPMLRGGDIHDGRIGHEQPRIAPEKSAEYSRTVLKTGDVVIALVGYPGESAVVPSRLDGANISRAVGLLRPSRDLDAQFLVCFLNAPVGRAEFLRPSAGSAQIVVNLSALNKMTLPVPPFREQRAIAEALTDADAAIESISLLIEKKRDIQSGVMQRLLSCETRLAKYSMPWNKKPLSDLGVFLKGSGVKRDDALSGDLPCVRYGEIYTTHHNVIRDFSSYISRTVADEAKRIQVGDLLFAGSGETKAEIGKCVALAQDVEAYAGGDIIIFRPESENPVFLGWLMNTPQVARQKANFGQGDAVVHISASALASIEVSLPDLDEQNAIARVITDMEAEITALEARLEKTRALKQGMMQTLLTGRVRLPVQGEALDALEVAHA